MINKILNIQIFYFIWRKLTYKENINILNFFPNYKFTGKNILDLGCGDAYVLELLISNGIRNFKYLGLDNNQCYINRNKKKYNNKNYKFVKINIDKIDTVISKVDTAICHGFLHHISDDEIINLFKIFKKKIDLIIIEPTYYKKQNFLRKIIMSMDRGFYIRQDSHLLRILKKIGFKIIFFCITEKLSRIFYSSIVIHAQKS
jgi:SAM-dependent methyltransferase